MFKLDIKKMPVRLKGWGNEPSFSHSDCDQDQSCLAIYKLYAVAWS